MGRFVEAVNWLESLQKFGIKPGLGRMQRILEQLGFPQHRLKFVHIAGTNGKGSTVQYISSVLREAGYAVGTFTSPAMETFADRIQLNGENIPDESFAELVERVKPLVQDIEHSEWGAMTEFEVTTVLAILYFAEMAYPDIVIWETGLGGRLDSTNVVFPLVSAVTNVGFDHMNILGNRLEDIAAEKAGIIKNGFPAVTGEQDPDALEVLESTAKQKKARLYRLGKDFHAERLTQGWEAWEETFCFKGPFGEYQDLSISMAGEHQVRNAGLSVMVLELLRQYYAFHYTPEELARGLKAAHIAGRLEIIEKDPVLILDGAHNMDGIKAFLQTFQERFAGRKASVLFSALEDKDVKGMIELLAPACRKVYVTQIDHPRAEQASNMEMWFRDASPHLAAHAVADWREAVQRWYADRQPDDVLLAIGSLYMVSDMKKEWGKAKAFCSDFKEKAGE